MSLTRRALERRGADPTLPWGSSMIPTNGMLGAPSASGIQMTDDLAMSISVVNACVRNLCDDVGTLPFRAYKKTKDRSKVEVTPPAVVENPWPEGTRTDFMVQVVASIALRGNFFGKVVDRDPRSGLPLAIMPLHPDDVMCRRNRTTGKREYYYRGVKMNPDDVFHIPGILMPGEFVGLDPISYMRNSWGLTASAEQYGGTFFRNSAMPGGVIEVPEDLSEEETLELSRTWSQIHGGVRGSGMPGVLTGGATWKQMSITPDNAQFLQTREFQRVDIAGFFGMPLHRLGLQDRSSGAGNDAESDEMYYVTNTLVGWLNRIESYFSMPTVTPQNITVAFDVTGRLRGNTIARYQAWTLGRNGGWLNSNDIRALESLPDLPADQGGDIYWGPLNFAPQGKLADGSATPSPGVGTVPSGFGGPGGGNVNHPDAPAVGGAPTSGVPNANPSQGGK